MKKNPGSLKTRTLRAGLVVALTALASNVLRVGSSLVMTRLLVPEVFGIVALSTAIYVMIGLFSDIGLRQSVVGDQRGEDEQFLDNVWTLHVVRGAGLAAVAAFIALILWGLAHAGVFSPDSVYAHPDLPAVLALTGVTSIWAGFWSIKIFVLERRLDFRASGYLELSGQVAGTVSTIVLAYYWRSIWAIVAGMHIGILVNVLLSHRMAPGRLPVFRWDKQTIKGVVRYGRWILFSSVAYVVATNLDRTLLGVLVTPTALGLYGLAANIVLACESVIGRPFHQLGMPAIAEAVRSGHAELRTLTLRFRRLNDLISVGLAGFLFAVGQLVIDVLYDPRYAAAGKVLSILSFSLVFARYNTLVQIHLAVGDPKTGSWLNSTRAVSIAVLLPLGYTLLGLEGALWAISLHMLPATMVILARNQKHGLNDFGFEARMLLAWPAGAAVGWAGAWLARPVLDYLGVI